jgi:hypothetical protein
MKEKLTVCGFTRKNTASARINMVNGFGFACLRRQQKLEARDPRPNGSKRRGGKLQNCEMREGW